MTAEFIGTVLTGTTNLIRGNERKFTSATPASSTTIQSYRTNASVPLARGGHSLVYYNNTLIMFGGYRGGFVNDLVQYNLTTQVWTTLPNVSGPSGRYVHRAIINGSSMYLFGGFDFTTFYSQMWKYDLNTFTWSLVANGTIPGRYGHLMFTSGIYIYVFSGRTGGGGDVGLNDIWRFDTTDNSWTELLPSGPPLRREQAAGSLIADKFYVFSGTSYDGILRNDHWVYDITGNTWTDLGVVGAPSNRIYHSAASVGTDMYILGGATSAAATVIDDFWRYDSLTNVWTNLTTSTRPPLRSLSFMVSDNSNLFVAHGSSNGLVGSYLEDVWATTSLIDPIVFIQKLSGRQYVNSSSFVFNDNTFAVSIESGFVVMFVTISLAKPNSPNSLTLTSIIVNFV